MHDNPALRTCKLERASLPRTPPRIAGPAPVPADASGHLDEHEPPVADLPELGAPGLASQEGTDGPVEGAGLNGITPPRALGPAPQWR